LPILIVASVGLRSANAQAKLDAYYTATLLGLPIGRRRRVVSLVVGRNHPSSKLLAGKWSDEVGIVFNGNRAKESVPAAPGSLNADYVPIKDADRVGASDPMTALLVYVPGTGVTTVPQACERTVAIFDGHTRYNLGLAALTEALNLVATTGPLFCHAELFRLKGELLLKRNESNQAEASFREAIHVASIQHAKLLELRATVSLAQLWRDQGKLQQARELLAPVYGWFTEGFDTFDLKEAKALLDELHA
jgi:hypothetical protein